MTDRSSHRLCYQYGYDAGNRRTSACGWVWPGDYVYVLGLEAEAMACTSDVKDRDWELVDGQRVLIALRFCEYDYGWYCFDMDFVGIALEAFQDVDLNRDARDVTWTFRRNSGGWTVPFCWAHFSFQKDQNNRPKIRVKRWLGPHDPRKPRSFVDRLLRRPEIVVPQERAPASWKVLSRRTINGELRKLDGEELCVLLFSIGGHASDAQAEWASSVLHDYLTHPDAAFRWVAVEGIGEIARQHGYLDRDRVLPLVTQLLQGADARVRRIASKSFDEIARFTGR